MKSEAQLLSGVQVLREGLQAEEWKLGRHGWRTEKDNIGNPDIEGQWGGQWYFPKSPEAVEGKVEEIKVETNINREKMLEEDEGNE